MRTTEPVDCSADQIGLEDLSQAAACARDIARPHASVASGDALGIAGVADQVSTALPRVSSSLRETMADKGWPSTAKSRHIRECLESVDPDVLGLIGINTLFSAAVRGGSLLWAQTAIGRAVAVEHHATLARRCNAKAVARLVEPCGSFSARRSRRDAVQQGRGDPGGPAALADHRRPAEANAAEGHGQPRLVRERDPARHAALGAAYQRDAAPHGRGADQGCPGRSGASFNTDHGGYTHLVHQLQARSVDALEATAPPGL